MLNANNISISSNASAPSPMADIRNWLVHPCTKYAGMSRRSAGCVYVCLDAFGTLWRIRCLHSRYVLFVQSAQCRLPLLAGRYSTRGAAINAATRLSILQQPQRKDKSR